MKYILSILLILFSINSFCQVTATASVSATIYKIEKIDVDSTNSNHLIFKTETSYNTIIEYSDTTEQIISVTNNDIYIDSKKLKTFTIIYN
jgi:hypothetical protein